MVLVRLVVVVDHQEERAGQQGGDSVSNVTQRHGRVDQGDQLLVLLDVMTQHQTVQENDEERQDEAQSTGQDDEPTLVPQGDQFVGAPSQPEILIKDSLSQLSVVFNVASLF